MEKLIGGKGKGLVKGETGCAPNLVPYREWRLGAKKLPPAEYYPKEFTVKKNKPTIYTSINTTNILFSFCSKVKI